MQEFLPFYHLNQLIREVYKDYSNKKHMFFKKEELKHPGLFYFERFVAHLLYFAPAF